MATTSFSKKWDALEAEGFHGGRFRVFPDGPLDLFIGYAISGEREFTLESDSGGIDGLELPSFEHIALIRGGSDGRGSLVLRLVDRNLAELFAVICADLAEASSGAATRAGSLHIFAVRLGRWSRLLKRRAGGGMSFAEQLGLLGELSVLAWLIEEASVAPAAVIRGWRGADGDDSDIGINGLCIEVKAQLATQSPALKVSSLDQLSGEDKRLYLVHSQFSSAEDGISLSGLVGKISSLIESLPDAQGEFIRKLYLLSYDGEADYASRSYVREQSDVYVVQGDFPRLTPNNVPPGIFRAKYEISCDAVAGFRRSFDELAEALNG